MGGGVKRTFLEDDNRRRLASERHVCDWSSGFQLRGISRSVGRSLVVLRIFGLSDGGGVKKRVVVGPSGRAASKLPKKCGSLLSSSCSLPQHVHGPTNSPPFDNSLSVRGRKCAHYSYRMPSEMEISLSASVLERWIAVLRAVKMCMDPEIY